MKTKLVFALAAGLLFSAGLPAAEFDLKPTLGRAIESQIANYLPSSVDLGTMYAKRTNTSCDFLKVSSDGPRSGRVTVCFAALAFAGPRFSPVSALPPDSKEDPLEIMNAPLARECLEAAGRLQQWRDDYRALREAVDAARKGNRPPPSELLDRLRSWVGGVDGFVQKASDRFRERTLIKEKIERAREKLNTVEEKVRAMPFDPENSPYKSREEFEQATLASLQLEGLVEVAGAYHDEVFVKIEALKNPARVADDLFQELISRKVLDNPVEWNGLTFRIKNFNLDTSIRSPFLKEPGLEVELAYSGGIKLEANGLYFGRDGKPVFDNLTVKTDVRSALAEAAGPLTKQILAGLPLPLTVEEVEPVDFKTDGAGRGALRVRVRFALVEFLKGMEACATLLITPKEIKLDGEVGFADATITVPIGSTPLAFRGIDVRVDMSKKHVSVGSIISTTAGDPRTVGLDIKASFAIPLKEITMTGKLLLAGQPVGDVEGTISAEKISGRLDVPCKDGSNPLPIGELLTIHGDFELNREGLSSDARVCLFKARESKMKLRISFSGDGSLELQEGFELLGTDASAGMTAAFTPGFRELTMNAYASVDVNLEVFKVGASVQIDASTARKEAIRVTAAALGENVEFVVKDLSPLTPDYLAARLMEQLPDLFDRLTMALLELRERGGPLLAQAEEDLRNDVSSAAKKVGLDALRTPSPEFDKAMGEIAEGGKKAVEAGVKSRERAKEWIIQLSHDPVKTLQGTLDSLWGDLRAAIDPWERKRIQDRADEAEAELKKAKERKRKAQEEENRVQARLGGLLRAIYRGEANIDQKLGRAVPGRRDRASGLFIRSGYPACTAAGDKKDQPGSGKDALMSFTFQASGFQAVPGGAGGHDSDVTNGFVEFIGLRDPDETPKARINIPDFKHGSDLQARRLLYEKIAALIEAYVPGVEIEGRFHERALTVFNDTDEPVAVWVLAWTRPRNKDWQWRPVSPEQPEQAYAFTLRPGQRLPLLKERARGSEEAGPVTGAKVRLWADSESGFLWDEYRGKDLVLVSERDSCDKPVYYAEKMETYHHTLRTPSGPRTFTERVVLFRNNATTPVRVEARALTRSAHGGTVWHNAPDTLVLPGYTATLRRDNGWALRGSQVRWSARDDEGDRFRWNRYARNALAITDSNGYGGATIEAALQLLTSPSGNATTPASLDVRQPTWSFPPDEVRLPSVVGKTVQAAKTELTQAGLRAITPTNMRDADEVLGQEPREGTWLSPGGQVRLAFGIHVPQVTGVSLGRARAILSAAGLVMGTEQPDPRRLARYHDDDQVVGQQPAAHTDNRPSVVSRGASVRLTVNVRVPTVPRGTPLNQTIEFLHEHNLLGQYRTGADLATPVAGQGIMPAWTAPWTAVPLNLMIRVPSVERQTVDHALAILRGAGFPVREVRGEVVLRQSPAGNSWADPGALPEVLLTPGVTVPYLIGNTSQQALGVLRDKGLPGRIIRQHTEQVNDARAGKTLVSRQSVQGTVAVGTQVDLEVTLYTAVRGDMVGMWVCPELQRRFQVNVTAFNRDSSLRVRRGDRWLVQSTRWSYTGDVLDFGLVFRTEVEGASYRFRGTVRWLDKNHFHLTVDGKVWDFKRAGPM